MGSEPSLPRSAFAGTALVAALAIATIVVGFAPDAPLATVLLTAAFIGGSLSAIAHIAYARPLIAELVAERSGRAALAEELHLARARRVVAEQLDRAIDLADTEDAVLEVVGRALALLLPDRDNALLLAPPGRPVVTFSVAVGPDGLDEPELLGEATRCSSLSRGETVTAESSAELDACPHLAHHGWEVSSICVPIRVGDRNLGVAHSAGPAGDLPDDEARRLVEMVARRVATRIESLRAVRRDADHVTVDPLTRLPNHTLVQRRLRELLADGVPFALAFCDVDGFAAYNERSGTEAGDRALQVYAQVMGATLRPGDVVARFAGDRFLCLFPTATAPNAARALERVRESLALELALQEMEPFTVSVGVADSGDEPEVELLLEAADVALAVAKNSGGNRVVTSDFDELHLPDLGV